MSDRRNQIYRLKQEHKIYGPANSKINGDIYRVLPPEHQELFTASGGYTGSLIDELTGHRTNVIRESLEEDMDIISPDNL